MSLSFFLIISLFSQNIFTENLHYYPILKIIPEVEVSPFRGEQYTFELTQPFLHYDEKSLSFFDICNKGQIPFPSDFQYYSILHNIPLENMLKSPPYLLQNLYITLLPSPAFPNELKSFPVYLTLRRFNKTTPFSQIRLFRKKTGSEKMQFTFGRKITKYGRFNIAADYLDEPPKTRRSMGLYTDFKLPFNTSSRLLFLDIRNDSSFYTFEDKCILLSISRNEGNVGFIKKNIGGKDEMGIISDIYLRLPYQAITVGFDYPDFYSSFYQVLLVDQINPLPLLYVVPRFAFDANQEWTVSLGSGYHPLVNLYLYGNLLQDKDKTIYSSFGLRVRTKKSYFESFVYTRNRETGNNSGIALSCNGEVFSNFHISSLIVTKINNEPFIYLQPFYQKPFKKGKLKPGLFAGIQYNDNETKLNAGIIIEIIDASLYFVFDDVNSNEERAYRFGVQWNFYD